MGAGIDLLETGSLTVGGFLQAATNRTFLAEVASGDADGVRAVYKPIAGEAPLWDFPPGTLANREVAAYRLSLALGWPRIPPTVLRSGPLGEGAVQLFVEHDPAHHYFTLRGACPEEFVAVAAFDVIVNNADRKGGHCLLDADGRVWVIDHGLCFHEDPKLRTVIWDFAGTLLPPDRLADVERVAGELGAGSLRDELGSLLSEREIDRAAARAEGLAAERTLPRPGPGRVVPWPPV